LTKDAKQNILCFRFRPLQRMGWGMFFAGVSFVMAGVLQIVVDVRNIV